MEHIYRVADDAQKNENAEGGHDVDGRGGATEISEGAAPERTDIGGVDGAAPAVGSVDEERAESAETRGGVPVQRSFATGFEGTTK